MSHPFFKKVFLSTLILCASFFVSLSVNAQMRQVYLDNTEPNNQVRKISFYTPSEGFVAFDSWIGYTVDTGKTFIKRYITNNVNYNGYLNVNTLPGFWIEGVKAFDQNKVIAYGSYGLVPAILSSTDGGLNYTLVYHSQFNNLQLLTGIKDMVFPQNNTVGYAVDADRILKTTNQGLSWTVVRTEPARYFDYLEAVDNNNVFAMSVQPSTNKLIKTTNAGATWQTVVLPVLPGGKLSSTYFLTASIGWLCMYDNDYKYYTYKTINGGTSWNLQNNVEAAPFAGSKLKFFDQNIGFALAGQNTVYKTSNGGILWEQLPRDNNYSYLNYNHNDLQCLSPTQLWAGGGHGFLEMSNNGGGTPLPRACFLIDTVGVSATTNVSLINYSRTGYTYKWYKNNIYVGNTYNSNYSHNINSYTDSVKLVVTNGIMSDSFTRYQNFNVPPPPPIPTITNFIPNTCFSGDVVTITGTNFTGTTSVKFGGTSALSFNVVSPTIITAIVASGSSGDVLITTTFGTATSLGFIYLTRLTLSSFSPLSGPVGTIVSINGTNFSPILNNNIVYFGDVRANVINSTATQLQVQAPFGASTKPILVNVNGSNVSSNLPFSLTFLGNCPINQNSFNIPTDSISDFKTYKLGTHDFDGDGKPDLVSLGVSNGNIDQRIVIQRNTSNLSTISFSDRQFFSINNYQTGYNQEMEIMDMDGDGKLDIITNTEGFSILRNTSTIGNISFSTILSFSWTPILGNLDFLKVGDFDGDGKPEVVGVKFGRIYIIKNNSTIGQLSFSTTALNYVFSGGGDDYSGLIIKDFDSDGKSDIAMSQLYYNEPSVRIIRNTTINGVISFSTSQIFRTALGGQVALSFESADIDGDGKSDLITTVNDSLCILKNTSLLGSISFITNFKIFAGVEPGYFVNRLNIGDFNGDGKPDILTLFHTNTNPLVISINRSSPNLISFDTGIGFGIGNLYQVGGNGISQDIKVTDFNLDGKPDFARIMYRSPTLFVSYNSISIYRNNICENTIIEICSGTPSSNITSNILGNTYQWQQDAGNGYLNISNSPNFSGTNTATLGLSNVTTTWNGYKYRCLVNNNQFSSIYLINIRNSVLPSINISTNNNSLCQGVSAIFSATISNGGTTPTYQWQVNGINVGTNSNTFTTTTLTNNAQVKCILTSSAACASPFTVTSNVLNLTVNSAVVPTLSITSSANNICTGTPVTFTATTTNAGTTPSYQWQVNGINVGTNSTTFTSTTLNNNDQVKCILTSNAVCASPLTVTSNVISVVVNPIVVPTISISTLATTICAGASTTFTAVTNNGGTTPSYQWQVNGLNVGTNSNSFTTSTLTNNDQVKCIITSNAVCAAPVTATSNLITITVNAANIVPTISINTSNLNTCSGSAATFTAIVTNGGTTPTYQWQVNGINAGTNSTTFTTTTLTNNAQVKCILTSNASCASPLTVTSNILTVTVNPVVVSSVLVTSTATNICAGSSITFTAAAINGGTTPSYQWQINGTNVGTNSNTFTSSALTNNDQVKCILTSNAACASPQVVTSNIMTVIVNVAVVPTVAITSTANNICSGSSITFTATPTNGGTTPSYQWQVNGVNTGTNSNTFTSSTLTNASDVKVIMTSSLACASPQTATSNLINVTVNNTVVPIASFTPSATSICNGASITFTSTSTNVGTAPIYQWKKNGANVGANSATYTSNGFANGDVVTLTLTSNAACANTTAVVSNPVTIIVATEIPTITIAGNTTVVVNNSTNITSTNTFGGILPTYQWQDSTALHTWANISGATSASLMYIPTAIGTGNKLRCVITSNSICALGITATSNVLAFNVTPTIAPPPNPNGEVALRYYPNPVRTILTIDSLKVSEQWESLSIMSLNGSRNMIDNNIAGKTKVTVNVANLSSGMYMIVLRRKDGNPAYLKFIKE
jgi:hypothetical protein